MQTPQKPDEDDEIFKSMNKVSEGDSKYFWGIVAGALLFFALAFCRALF
jgi:hypothetical protein